MGNNIVTYLSFFWNSCSFTPTHVHLKNSLNLVPKFIRSTDLSSCCSLPQVGVDEPTLFFLFLKITANTQPPMQSLFYVVCLWSAQVGWLGRARKQHRRGGSGEQRTEGKREPQRPETLHLQNKKLLLLQCVNCTALRGCSGSLITAFHKSLSPLC